MKPLSVFVNNHLIGYLFYERGQLSFQYVNHATIALSKQLPIQAARFPHAITESFFSGLLPDEPEVGGRWCFEEVKKVFVVPVLLCVIFLKNNAL